jgi:hypothetical protein
LRRRCTLLRRRSRHGGVNFEILCTETGEKELFQYTNVFRFALAKTIYRKKLTDYHDVVILALTS